MADHGGRHTDEYHDAVRKALDDAYEAVKDKTPQEKAEALQKVMKDIAEAIRTGSLQPYKSKSVQIIEKCDTP
jgi:hypothetical protein